MSFVPYLLRGQWMMAEALSKSHDRRAATSGPIRLRRPAALPIATPGGTDVQHPNFMNQPVGALPSETRQRKQWLLGAGRSDH